MATLMMASPQFELSTFLSRLTNMLPGMPVVGGVTDVTDQHASSLFLGSHAHTAGAVGVLMEGPVSLESRWVPPGVQISPLETGDNQAMFVFGLPVSGSIDASPVVHGAHTAMHIEGRKCHTSGSVVSVLSRAVA